MLRRQDVGHRVVVRRIVGVRNDRPLYSDALGELVEITETDLTIATSKGPLRVPLDEIHRAKRVPPTRRPNAADVVALELAANEAWPAPVQDRLGGWLLRAADGWTGRGNSALPVGDPDRPLEAAIDAVERWYRARGAQPLVNTPLPLAAPVAAALDARGWTARPLTLVQTAPLRSVLDATPSRARVELTRTPSDAWLTVAAGRKGGLPDAARHILTAVRQVRFAHVYGESGDLLATGRGTITGGHWLGLALIEVVPEARRGGLAQDVVGALARWAAEAGASRAFLQVEERNTAAVALYAKLGFSTHHSYLTREGPKP
ncbi:GNAT family N-acetyltransferase [Phytohabitans sp. ZYX-F-186]|uniref:GNAT family N-acetyltransferase n=1 Tax=Phytohabitans maris TaxID=3071409 RepID=A0ABU0ZWB9_9ACTN|nr:GNAT family N-acetyltransferase [Phytohabitans sp. ZYX-F-186]MDQ7910505.1 GNAT family N-acetyltransferase [Phytohabitans sp. ZYX-F-186]